MIRVAECKAVHRIFRGGSWQEKHSCCFRCVTFTPGSHNLQQSSSQGKLAGKQWNDGAEHQKCSRKERIQEIFTCTMGWKSVCWSWISVSIVEVLVRINQCDGNGLAWLIRIRILLLLDTEINLIILEARRRCPKDLTYRAFSADKLDLSILEKKHERKAQREREILLITSLMKIAHNQKFNSLL